MCGLSGLIILDELTSSHEEVCRAEPNAYDFLMYRGAVRGRAETILRSAKAFALGN